MWITSFRTAEIRSSSGTRATGKPYAIVTTASRRGERITTRPIGIDFDSISCFLCKLPERETVRGYPFGWFCTPLGADMERFCVFARRPSLPLLRITANKKILNYGRNMGGSHIRHRTEQKIQNATKIGRNYSKSEWFPADFLRFVLYGRGENAQITERDWAFKTRQTSRLFGRFARLFASGEGVLTQHGRKKAPILL